MFLPLLCVRFERAPQFSTWCGHTYTPAIDLCSVSAGKENIQFPHSCHCKQAELTHIYLIRVKPENKMADTVRSAGLCS